MLQEEIEAMKAMEEVKKDMDSTLLMQMPVEKSIKGIVSNSNGQFSIEDYAIAFVYGMGKKQRDRFKKMLENNIKCGESVAYSYGVDYDQLINEVKRILKVEE